MVCRVWKLAFDEKIALEGAGDNRYAVGLIANTSVANVLFVQADGLKVDPLFEVVTPDL